MPPRPMHSRNIVSQLITREAYICPSCRFRQTNNGARSPSTILTKGYRTNSARRSSIQHNIAEARIYTQSKNLSPTRSNRRVSHGTLASATAINAPSTVPPELRELHQRLLLLQERAGSYVNLSQLQLCLRSLESEDPVVRIAFLALGSHGRAAARQLVRVLLSDALEPEEPWEMALRGEGDGRNILLRYGDYTDISGVQPNTPLMRTMNIPSRLLQKLNLEIMVTSFNTNGLTAENAHEVRETILVPALTISNSNAGRVGFVRHPVHQALIISQGVQGALEFGRLPPTIVDQELVRAALSLPLRSASGAVSSEEESTSNAVDIDLASHALGLFRDSKANGATFSEEWQTSRVPNIAAWLQASTDNSSASDGLKPAVRSLLQTVLIGALNAVAVAESRSVATSKARGVSEPSRDSLRGAISAWSSAAHRDLRSNFDAGLDSVPWRKTAWWRLFWRIDEVSLSASDVLRCSWLVEAEQTLAFLSGRILEAGVATSDELKRPEGTEVNPEMLEDVQSAVKNAQSPTSPSRRLADLWNLEPLLERRQQESGLNILFDPPWPQTINIARQRMLHELVPSIHRKAQALLLGVLSTIGVSGGIAGTLFVASGGVAFYEAGALGALGVVWSLRRLQKKWSRERENFVQTAREDGRTVLLDVEKRLRMLVKDGGRFEVSAGDEREWRDARAAIQACQESLKSITKP